MVSWCEYTEIVSRKDFPLAEIFLAKTQRIRKVRKDFLNNINIDFAALANP